MRTLPPLTQPRGRFLIISKVRYRATIAGAALAGAMLGSLITASVVGRLAAVAVQQREAARMDGWLDGYDAANAEAQAEIDAAVELLNEAVRLEEARRAREKALALKGC